MIEFRHILCPIDFSDASIRALTYATAIAASYQAQLTVVHVAPTFAETIEPIPAGDAGRAPIPGSREDIVARIGSSLERAGATALAARPLALEGHAIESIVNCAAALRADLLVMGTHGLGGFRHLLLGSVTEKVTRTATCPVLTVPPVTAATIAGPIVFRKILCPIDYSPSALKALEYALELGRQADGCLTVLYALEYLDPEEPCEHVDYDIRRQREHFLQHARERLQRQLAAMPQTGCEIEPMVAVNRAYKEILQRAAASDLDLIVMGAQGSGGIELMLYGSNTQHVVRAAPCPVLSVRA